MKITKKRIISLLLASLMLMSVFGTLTAEAASKPQLESTSGTCYLKKGKKETTFYVFIFGTEFSSQVTNVKSSNPAVATATVKDFASDIALQVKAKKVGTTTLSCTVRGKTLKYKLTVCRYVNPIQQFMVGDQDYASKFNQQTDELEIANPGAPVTLNVTPKTGWKLKKIMGDAGKKKSVKIKNGEAIDPNNYYEITFTFQKKKVTEEITIVFEDMD